MTDTSTITVDGNSPLLYEKGMVVAHSSDESGIPDCGISVGLGGGQMLYAGELPMPFSTGIKIYTRDTSILVANDVDYDVARIMIEVIATALEPQTPAQAARVIESSKPARDAAFNAMWEVLATKHDAEVKTPEGSRYGITGDVVNEAMYAALRAIAGGE